jgi:hypothetical protein
MKLVCVKKDCFSYKLKNTYFLIFIAFDFPLSEVHFHKKVSVDNNYNRQLNYLKISRYIFYMEIRAYSIAIFMCPPAHYVCSTENILTN